MSVSILDVMSRVKEFGVSVTYAQAKAAIDAVDRTPLETAERTQYEVVVWDKASPINGVPAEEILSNWFRGVESFIVKINGATVIFQTLSPNGGPMLTREDAERESAAMVERMVADAVDRQVFEAAVIKLLEQAG